MLTADRFEMTARAVAAFQAQTYGNKKLLVLDTGKNEFSLKQAACVYGEWFPKLGQNKIGALRNMANDYSKEQCLKAEVICHFDSDDVSHPLRIEEQVALLQASGADVVGYSDMLFWRLCPQCNGFDDYCADVATCETCKRAGGQAWLYRNLDRTRYCVGTSLCYWRKVWEAKPFNPKLPERRGGTGEDTEWLRGLKSASISSMATRSMTEQLTGIATPRMIASIHGSNTQDYRGIEKSPNSWTRVPEWDKYCREKMAL